jgi:ABC-2 type transport system ATP-binding protein
MLHLQNVTKLYGSVIGVNDVTLTLQPGAYGLLGPNGSGKSTLLNLITGQLRPTLGELRVLDRRPWNNARLYRLIGVCPEQDMYYANVTGLDWVRYLLQLHGFGHREAGRRAAEALEMVGMSGAVHRRMGEYSRGMRQRTKLAQALAHEPELLVLDEPFQGVDPVGRSRIGALLRDWLRAGKSLLMASHILQEVEAVTSSFLLICGGRLLASGSAEEVRGLLADLPNEILIRCDKPSDLARCLFEEEGLITGLRFAEHGKALVISTRNPAKLYARLPEWIRSANVRVTQLYPTDSSLQSLFDSLLHLHRAAGPPTNFELPLGRQ